VVEDVLELAKGLANGPPLSASGAVALKWEDARWVSDPSCELSQTPVNLRDGSLLYLRSRNDALTAAKVAAKAKAAAAASSSSGKGRGKVGNKQQPWQQSSSLSSGGSSSSSSGGGRSERGIHIAVSHGEGGGGGGGGNDDKPGESLSSSSTTPTGGVGESTTTKLPLSPRSKVAKAMKVPLENAAMALEAAGGDEALARSFLMSEIG
jgi:hypothetical protein